jgi:hypothetical protein
MEVFFLLLLPACKIKNFRRFLPYSRFLSPITTRFKVLGLSIADCGLRISDLKSIVSKHQAFRFRLTEPLRSLFLRYTLCPMRYALVALLFALGTMLLPVAEAATVTLAWDSNVDEDLAGYIVYYGTASRDYDYDVDVGEETSCTISGLEEGRNHYFAVTAYDVEGNESQFSEEVSYPNAAVSGSSGGGGSGVGCFIASMSPQHTHVVRQTNPHKVIIGVGITTLLLWTLLIICRSVGRKAEP